jgi:hypothetical protein
LDKFSEDLESLIAHLVKDAEPDVAESIRRLEERLVELREKNLLKINHSVLELIVAKFLVSDGFDVDLEHVLDSGLSCDVYAVKGEGTLIVEVETGFVPPAHALDPMDYIRARIASKIARYSNHCHKFSLAAPPHYIMPVPRFFVKPPRSRSEEELAWIKRYCDMYYTRPPVSMDEILNSRMHSVQIIDVDTATVREIDPVSYIDRCEKWYA